MQAIAHGIYASFQFISKTIFIFIIRDALMESLCPNYFVCQRFRYTHTHTFGKHITPHHPRMQSRGLYLANIYSVWRWRCGQKNLAKATTILCTHRPDGRGAHVPCSNLKKVLLTNNLCSVWHHHAEHRHTRQPPTAKNATNIFFIFVYTCSGRWLRLVAWLPSPCLQK